MPGRPSTDRVSIAPLLATRRRRLALREAEILTVTDEGGVAGLLAGPITGTVL